jgi:hypothetical protein
MKQGMCVINFMLLNVLVGKLYRHFRVRKLVGHPVEHISMCGLVGKKGRQLDLPDQHLWKSMALELRHALNPSSGI